MVHKTPAELSIKKLNYETKNEDLKGASVLLCMIRYQKQCAYLKRFEYFCNIDIEM